MNKIKRSMYIVHEIYRERGSVLNMFRMYLKYTVLEISNMF